MAAQTRCRAFFSPDPISVVEPSYIEMTHLLESAEWWSGKEKELDGIQAGGASLVFDNEDRWAEVGVGGEIATLTASGNEITDASRALRVDGDARPFQDQERWADFEAASAGSATGWDSLEAPGGSAQFTTVGSPLLEGAKAGKFTVREGDSTGGGERSEVVWTSGYGTGEVDGQTIFCGGGITPEGPFEHTDDWEIGHQVHADSRFDQAPLRLQVNAERTHWEIRLVSGEYADSGDALAGTDPGTDLRWQGLPFEDDVTARYRYAVRWASDDSGFLIWQMRRSTEVAWTTYVQEFGIQTLPTYPGQGAATTVYLKWGWYRHNTTGQPDAGITNVVYHDGIYMGHRWEDLDLEAEWEALRDSSVGIWPATTNLISNGSFETNTTNWGTNGADTTIDRVTDQADVPFGTACLRLTMGTSSASSSSAQFSPTLVLGTVYRYSCWVKVPLGVRQRIWVTDGTNTLATFTFTGDGRWRRVSVTFTGALNGVHRLRVGRTAAAGAAQVVYLKGAQLETGTTLTPYVHTDGGTATRSAGRVQVPASFLDETQGWFAIRVRMGFDADDAPSSVPYLFRWRDDDDNELRIRFDASTDKFVIDRRAAASGGQVSSPLQTFQRGDYLTIVGRWTATEVGIAVDRSGFTDTANANVPTLASTTFDIGSSGSGGTNHLAGSVLWAAMGTGTLTDADALAFYDFQNTDPFPAQLPGLGTTSVWSADEATSMGGRMVDLWRRFKLVVEDDTTTSQEGVYFLAEPRLNFRGKSRSSLVQFNCVDGIGKLAGENLPRMDPPDATSFEEVVAFFEPWGFWRLGEPEGTKLVAHSRRKRKRRKGESRRHYRHHGIRRWKTRETRADVEGAAGSPGTYKNTPTLGVAGAIVGDEDTAVSFAFASDEHASVPVEADDFAKTTGMTLACFFNPTGGGYGTLISGPTNTVAAANIFKLGHTGTNAFLGWVDASDASASLLAAHTPSPGTWYFFAGTITAGAQVLYAGTLGGTLAVIDTETAAFSGGFATANDDLFVTFMRDSGGGNQSEGTLDEPFIVERVLDFDELNGIFVAASRGYPMQTAGERIAALSVSDLWLPTGIDTGGYDVQPVFQYGQSPLEEIDAAVEAEMPDGLYFFDGDAQPVHLPVGYKSVAPYDTATVLLTNDQTDAEANDGVRYDDRQIDWDNEVYTVVSASKDGGLEQLVQDDDAIAARGEHVFTGAQGLLNNDDADVLTIATTILAGYSGPPVVRPRKVSLHGADPDQRAQIMAREIGDLVQFKHYGDTGDPLDVNCRILGWKKRYEKTQLTAEWNLSRAE